MVKSRFPIVSRPFSRLPIESESEFLYFHLHIKDINKIHTLSHKTHTKDMGFYYYYRQSNTPRGGGRPHDKCTVRHRQKENPLPVADSTPATRPPHRGQYRSTPSKYMFLNGRTHICWAKKVSDIKIEREVQSYVVVLALLLMLTHVNILKCQQCHFCVTPLIIQSV